MSKQFKRSLAMILAVIMVLGMLPVMAFAAGSLTVSSVTGVKVIAKENGTLALEASSSNVKWMSSNSQIASVDANGVVTAKDKNGTVMITAISTADSSVRGTFIIDVAIPGNFYNVTEVDETYYSYVSSSATNYVFNPDITFNGSWGIYNGEQLKHRGGAKSSISAEGGYFEYTFKGTGIQVLVQKTKLMSAYNITLDGEDKGNYSLYTTNEKGESQAVIFEATDLENTTHTIRGTLVAEDGRLGANLDGFNVLTPAYDTYVVDNNINSSSVFNPQITYSGAWRSYAYTGEPEKHLGGAKTDGVADGTSYVEYTFTGIGVELIAQKTKYQGAYQVFIDNQDMGTYSMYSEAGQNQASIFKKIGLKYGTHTIKCVAVSEGGRNEINFDAFKVYVPASGSYVVENVVGSNRPNPDITTTGFVGIWGAPSEFRGEGATVEYTFSGTGIEVYAMKQIYQESFNIYIDNVFMGKFSLYPPSGNTEQGAFLFGKYDLANTSHTIKLVAAIDGDSARSSGIETNFDYFKVFLPEHTFENVDTVDAKASSKLVISNASKNSEYGNTVCFNGSQLELKGENLTAEYTFIGTGIAVYGMRQIYQDAAHVYIDGVDYGVWSFYPKAGTTGSDTVNQALIFEKTDLDFGEHTIKLVACADTGLELSREGNTNWAITIDYFKTYNDRTTQFIDDRNLITETSVTNPDFINDGYSVYASDYKWGGHHYFQTKSETKTPNATIEYPFYGEGIEVIGSTNISQHSLAVNIDGTDKGLAQEFGNFSVRSTIYMTALSEGAHTIKLTNTKCDLVTNASYKDVINTNIDGFRVYLPYNFNMTDLDKAALIKAIEESYDINTEGYQADMVATFETSLANAVATANNLYTSQWNVDKAVTALEKAAENFDEYVAPAFKTEYVSDGVVSNNAVAYIYDTDATDGETVNAFWNGTEYSFVYGENAFASMYALKEAFAGKEAEIIIPAGFYNENLVVAGSWKICGEDYKTNPNVISGNSASLNGNWGANGQSIINASIIIDAAATPADDGETNIYIAGIKYTNQLLDHNRTLSNGKTKIVLENIVHERLTQTGSGRDFAFNCANATNSTNSEYNNIDEFTIKNYHYINTNAGGHLMLAGELMAPFFTLDGFVCAQNAPSFGYPKFNKYASKTVFTVKNSYFNGMSNNSRTFLFEIAGHHNTQVTSDERADLDTTINIENNIFIDCLTENVANAHNSRRAIFVLYPQSFNNINITGNEVVSTADKDSEFVSFSSADWSNCTKDRSDIVFKNNRLIGVLPAAKVNDVTTLDFSENYFADYSTDYQLVNNADIPMDTDANYYLDYAKTVKRYDIIPESTVIANFTAIKKLDVLYGYLTEGTYTDLGLTGTADYVADEVTVKAGETVKTTVTATKGGVTYEYALYIIGVKDVADVANAKTVADTVYYPSLYGAPNGIKAVTYYDGEAIIFETGKNSASSPAEVTFTKGDIILPDDITEFKAELGKRVNIKSAVDADIEITLGTIDVTAIGDSITYGAYMDNKLTDSWPGQMQTYLGDRYSVDNFGVSGATVTSVPNYESRQFKTHSNYTASLADGGDVVIIAFGINDADAATPTVDNWSSNKQFIKDYVELIDSYKALETKPQIIITTTLECLDSGYAQTNARLRTNLLYLEWYLAELTGAIVIDTNAKMLDCTGEDKEYSDYILSDKIHPNYEGYTKMSKIIGDELEFYTKDETNGWYMSGDTLVVYKDLGNFTAKNAPWSEYASSVKKIVVEDGVTEIGAWAFGYLKNVTEVSLPSTLTSIGRNAFYRNEALTEITIPEGITTIENGTFAYCYALETVNLPASLVLVEKVAFSACKSLETVTYAGENWAEITIKDGNTALTNCYPPIAEVFEWSVVDGVLTISGNVAMEDYASKQAPWYVKADEITAIVIEDGVKSIGKYAFAYLRNVETVEIADSVESIGSYAFYGCYNLTEIDVPDNVKTIGGSVFAYCAELKKVTIPASVTKLNKYTFTGNRSLRTGIYEGNFEELEILVGNDYFVNANRVEIPESKVDELGELTVPVAGENYTLETAYAFYATETFEDVNANSDYKYYHADFVVSFDKDITDVALAGLYDEYVAAVGSKNWVPMILENKAAGEETRLLKDMWFGEEGSISYQELCYIERFLCGALDLNDNDTGAKMTVELRLYEVTENAPSTSVETGEYVTIGSYTYTF